MKLKGASESSALIVRFIYFHLNGIVHIGSHTFVNEGFQFFCSTISFKAFAEHSMNVFSQCHYDLHLYSTMQFARGERGSEYFLARSH